MAGLPKKYIKKYGVSKRAWAEFRKAKGRRKVRRTKPKVRRRTKRVKVGGYRKMAKSNNSFLGISNNDIWKGVGAGSAGIVGGLVNQVSGGRVGGNVAQAIGSILLSKYGTGKLKQMGKGAVIKTIGDVFEEHAVPMISSRIGLGGK